MFIINVTPACFFFKWMLRNGNFFKIAETPFEKKVNIDQIKEKLLAYMCK